MMLQVFACTALDTSACPAQARCRGDLFIECSRLDDKVPISHEEQMSTLRKVRLAHMHSLHNERGLNVLSLQLCIRLIDFQLLQLLLACLSVPRPGSVDPTYHDLFDVIISRKCLMLQEVYLLPLQVTLRSHETLDAHDCLSMRIVCIDAVCIACW